MKTLLNATNDVLKKAKALDAQGELASLTDSARQMFIDTAIQSINETLDHLYDKSALSKPSQLKESSITLAASTQAYKLRSNMVTLRDEYGLVDETNNHIITILGDDGYRQLILGDLDQDDTGQPNWAAIRPTDGRLWLDRVPTGSAIGRVYKYRYDRDLELEEACDTFPFSNAVYRALVPAAAELYKFNMQQEFSQGLFDASIARASRFLRKLPRRTSWNPRRTGANVTDPMTDASVVS